MSTIRPYTNNKMFSRDELQEIRERSYSVAETTAVSPIQRRALHKLSDSADYLDAILARAVANGKLNQDIPKKPKKKK